MDEASLDSYRYCRLDFSEGPNCDAPLGFTTCHVVYGRDCGPTRIGNVTYERVCKRIAREETEGGGYQNFDNFGNAIMYLLASVTFEGHTDLMSSKCPVPPRHTMAPSAVLSLLSNRSFAHLYNHNWIPSPPPKWQT